MHMFHKALAVLLLSVIYIPGECQLKLEKYNSSTEIHENESLTFIGDTLVIDTLIMQNNSTLKLQSDTYIHIKYAILGESVSILNEGVVGTRGDVGVLLFPIGTDGERGTRW